MDLRLFRRLETFSILAAHLALSCRWGYELEEKRASHPFDAVDSEANHSVAPPSGHQNGESTGGAPDAMAPGSNPESDPSSSGGGSATPDPLAKRVFVSWETTTANLSGLDGGHAFCQAAADAQGLGGTWKAWLSGAGQSPESDFVQSALPYQLLDGTMIAENWDDLTDGRLLHGITVAETGATVLEAEVWTGTTPSGESTGETCGDWTSESAIPPYATVGINDLTGSQWTNIYLQFCDRPNVRLYCFEQ